MFAGFLLVDMKRTKLRNDIVLIGLLLTVTLIVFACMRFNRKPGGYAVVVMNGDEVVSYPLNEDRTIRLENPDVGGYNILVIENGYAHITEASCPDKLCAKHHKVNCNGETLVCLPNKTTVKIVSDVDPDTDFIT